MCTFRAGTSRGERDPMHYGTYFYVAGDIDELFATFVASGATPTFCALRGSHTACATSASRRSMDTASTSALPAEDQIE
ncbi:MAG: hypothetical protein R2726_04730 [Acidimicrobiales bacterium]